LSRARIPVDRERCRKMALYCPWGDNSSGLESSELAVRHDTNLEGVFVAAHEDEDDEVGTIRPATPRGVVRLRLPEAVALGTSSRVVERLFIETSL
jgi:hypothetical protein